MMKVLTGFIGLFRSTSLITPSEIEGVTKVPAPSDSQEHVL
jgi:hypothetical protein